MPESNSLVSNARKEMTESEWIAFHQGEFQRAKGHFEYIKLHPNQRKYFCPACCQTHDYTEKPDHDFIVSKTKDHCTKCGMSLYTYLRSGGPCK